MSPTFHSGTELRAALPMLPTCSEMWVVTLACVWFLGGLFLDGWAHNHIPELETFFTPWHAVFYSGYLATALSFIVIPWLRKRRNGGTFSSHIPNGFGYGLIGAGFFILGGIGDLIWHELFGIEANIEALLSPTHLVLAASMGLMVSAGLRVWFRTPSSTLTPNFLTQLPMLISASCTVSLIWFMTQFSHFIVSRASGVRPADAAIAEMTQNIAITGYLFHIAVIVGLFLLIIRRGRIAIGGFTLMFTLSMLAMALMRDGQAFIPAGIAAGIVADLLAYGVHPLERSPTGIRLFSFFVPAAFFAAYFLTLFVTGGVWWIIHLWAGSIVMAGLAGLLLSFTVFPLKE